MDGYLSNYSRDVITIIGLILGIVQILMAIAATRQGKSTRRWKAKRINFKWSKIPKINSSNDSKPILIVIAVTTLIIWGSPYLWFTFKGSDSVVYGIIFLITFIAIVPCLLIQSALVMGVSSTLLENIPESSGLYKFVNVGDGVMAIGALSFIVLMVALRILPEPNTSIGWFGFVVYMYCYMAILWSSLFLIVTTIWSVVQFFKFVSGKTN
jgi:hypothetical protein